MAVPSAVFAVTAALDGLPIFLILYHTSDNQSNDPRYYCACNYCSHTIPAFQTVFIILPEPHA